VNGGAGDAANPVELIIDAHAEIGEGPLWLAAENVLVWVDITRNKVHRYDPASGRNVTIDVGQPVGAAVPRAAGGLALALQDGFATLDLRTGRVEMIADVERDNPGNRMNDGKCDRAGRFWAGTMAFDERHGAGALYRLDVDHRVEMVVDDVTVSNGLDWTPDDTAMYYIDTPTGGVDVFDYDAGTGTLRGRGRHVTIASGQGHPDGMTVDAEGYLWVALWGGWAVHRYSPGGTLDRVIDLPVSQVTCCAFGGPTLEDLYITSAAGGLSDEDLSAQPHAGGLFRYRPGVRGRPAHSYFG